eukprot:7218967-Alexandrium_andersonii.AAC.1
MMFATRRARSHYGGLCSRPPPFGEWGRPGPHGGIYFSGSRTLDPKGLSCRQSARAGPVRRS